MIFTLASCGDPKIVGYHIDENGKLIATYDDDTTVDLGTLTDTIANGINKIEIDENGYYVINGVKTDIVAVDVFEVKFITGYDATVKAQIIKDGDKVERPQLEREGYTLKGWYCNGEEWRFNSDVVLSEMTLVAEWMPNTYSITFDSDGGNDIAAMTIATGDTLNLPTPQRDLYTFDGWYFNGNKVNSSTTFNYATDLNLVAKWHRTQYAITFDRGSKKTIA